jgi:hypothetical protein
LGVPESSIVRIADASCIRTPAGPVVRISDASCIRTPAAPVVRISDASCIRTTAGTIVGFAGFAFSAIRRIDIHGPSGSWFLIIRVTTTAPYRRVSIAPFLRVTPLASFTDVDANDLGVSESSFVGITVAACFRFSGSSFVTICGTGTLGLSTGPPVGIASSSSFRAATSSFFRAATSSFFRPAVLFSSRLYGSVVPGFFGHSVFRTASAPDFWLTAFATRCLSRRE